MTDLRKLIESSESLPEDLQVECAEIMDQYDKEDNQSFSAKSIILSDHSSSNDGSLSDNFVTDEENGFSDKTAAFSDLTDHFSLDEEHTEGVDSESDISEITI